MTGKRDFITINSAARRLRTNMAVIRRAIAAGELAGYADKAGRQVDKDNSESATCVIHADLLTWWVNKVEVNYLLTMHDSLSNEFQRAAEAKMRLRRQRWSLREILP